MNWKKIACTALAVPMLYVGIGSIKSSNVYAATSPSNNQTIEQKVEDKDIFPEPENCPKDFERKPFYFDEFQFTPLENVHLDGKLKGFAQKHASFHGTFFDFQKVLMFPTRFFGKCDWDSDRFTWTWGVGNEAYVEEDVRQLVWNLASSMRWYTEQDQFLEFGWQHHSFAKIKNDDTETYIEKNKINIENADIRDILFFKFADQLKFNDKSSLEYSVARNIWEAYFEDIPESFWNKEKRRPYKSVALDAKLSYSAHDQLDFSAKWQGEFATSRSSPQRFEFSVDLFSDSKRERGVSLFYQNTNGAGKDSISVGYHGLRMNGWASGIKLFHNSF